MRWDLTSSQQPFLVLSASDSDVGPNAGTVTYSLLTSPYPLPNGVSDGTNVFQINSTTGALSLQSTASPLMQFSNTVSEFLLTVRASDRGSPARTAQHALTIDPIPVPQFRTTTRTVDINEELPLGTRVLDLMCTEIGRPSGSPQVRLSGSGADYFLVQGSGSTFSIVVSRRIDYEQLSGNMRGFDFSARCSNTHGLSDVAMIRVNVNNVDDNVFGFEEDPYVVIVFENVTNGENILQVRALDEDFPIASVSYQTNSSLFRFVSSSDGMIVLAGSLDRESVDRYVVAITAEYNTSGVAMVASSTVVVSVADVNDNIPRLGLSAYFVNNITTGATIGDSIIQVTATDNDIGLNGIITYSISQNQTFSINSSTGEIIVASPLSLTTYEFTLYATDGGVPPLSSSSLVVITLRPYPIQVLLRVPDSIVDEDVPIGSLVTTTRTQLLDTSGVLINDTSEFGIRYELVNEIARDTFIISADTGEIFTVRSLDYDSLATRYELIVRAHYEMGENRINGSAVASINIENINDNPPRFMPQFYAVVLDQFTEQGTSVLNVSARDPDELAPVVYSLDSSGIPFLINPQSGEITASEDLVTAVDYRFEVVAGDGGREESTAAVYISITRPRSVAPVFTRSQFRFAIPENTSPGSFVGTVTAFAQNNLSVNLFPHIGYRISNPLNIDFNVSNLPILDASDNLFHVDQSSGNISTQGMFEFDVESRMNFFFYVEVYNLDDGMVYDYSTVEIELIDVNDNRPEFSQSLYTRVINTSQPTGSVILAVAASDDDSGTNGKLTYSISASSNGAMGHAVIGFAVNSTSGAISVSNSTLIPGDYYLIIEASDGGSPQLTESARVFIGIIPATPSRLEFSQSTYSFELAEDATPPTVVGVVSVVGANGSATPFSNATYSTPNVTDCFGVEASTGELILTCTTLDRESVNSYELVIEGRISADVSVSGVVLISILDINDNHPDFSLDVYTRVIDDRFGNGSPVVQVMASDPDLGTNGSITYMLAPNTPFQINEVTGEISLINNTIEVGDYRLSVYAVDMGTSLQLSSSALVLICVTRAYPQTLNFLTTAFNISENVQQIPSVVGVVVLVTNGGNMVNPSDFPDNLIFSIVGGDMVDGRFTIEGSTGVVSALTMFDREQAATHVIDILANFTQFSNIPLRSIQSSFTINILDENEAPAMDNILYDGVIDDSEPTGSAILNISATDNDAGLNALLNFSLVGAPTFFGIRVVQTNLPQTFGEIYVIDESLLVPETYMFDVLATDLGSPSLSSGVSRVEVVVEYSIPEEIYFNSSEYIFHTPESPGIDILQSPVAVGKVFILPVTPALNGLVYSLSGNGTLYFIINNLGVISTTILPIDRERTPVFELNITALLPSHLPRLSANTRATIIIEDVNDNAPVFNIVDDSYGRIGLSTDTLGSDSILNISASDADSGINSEIEYSIHSVVFNITHNLNIFPFMVNPTSGEVFVPFMNLSIGTYHVTFRATDRGNPPLFASAAAVMIIQQPAPDRIEFEQAQGFQFRMLENTAAGTDIGRIIIRNFPEYLENRLTFNIIDGSADFGIIRSTGMIQNLRPIDYEMDKNFTFTVGVVLSDVSRVPQLFLFESTVVTVIIEDANDNSPTFIDFPEVITQYEERPTPEVIHTIRAEDRDSGLNGALNFTILTTGLDDIVTIDQTGAITAAAWLDREDPRQGSPHNLIIEVCDMGTPPNCVSDTVVYQLLDINDNYPTLTSGFTYSVDERSPERSVPFHFRAIDPDLGVNGSVRYYLNTAPRAVPFWLSATAGRVVVRYFEIDYEVNPFFNISLRINDVGNPRRTSTYTNITVLVRDLPDSVPQFSLGSYQANTSPTVSRGDHMATVNATDADIPSSNDSLVYAVAGIRENGNRGVVPTFHIDQSGQIFSSAAQVFRPEAEFEVAVLVYDQSRFNLSNTTTVTVHVVPEVLEFTQSEFSVSVAENSAPGTFVASLPIRSLSFSSDIAYNTEPIQPLGLPNRFTTNGNGLSAVNITVVNDLDREAHDMWQIRVTARRTLNTRGMETASTILTVHVTDTNDNRPIFNRTNSAIIVMEVATSDTYVTKANASDLDIGENSRLSFTFVDEPPAFPFTIESSTGIIRTSGKIDYEVVPSYNATVRVRDHGSVPMEDRITYTINVININDNHPRFAAPAYFGEVYAKAPVNSLVSHTVLIMTDPDDVNGEEELLFMIGPASPGQNDNFRFQVTENKPYRIQVVQMPSSANDRTQLLRLIIEATDPGGLTALVPFYLSIFTSSNLVTFELMGIGLDTLLSCSANQTSMCYFREVVASVTKAELGTIRGITFYNNSARTITSNRITR